MIGPRPEQLRVARAGRLVNLALVRLTHAARPGVRAGHLDTMVRRFLASTGAVPAMLGYRDDLAESPFPAAVSINLNDGICGGSDRDRILASGDLITADLAVSLGGWYADAAHSWTIPGRPIAGRSRLVQASRRVTAAGVRRIVPGLPWSEVVAAMAAEAARLGVHLLRGYDGHGIGRRLHTPPRLPMHPDDLGLFAPVRLEAGMILAIEPVVAIRSTGVVRTGWSERTRDGSDACFTEVTIQVGGLRPGVAVGGRSGRPGISRNARVLAGFLDAADCMT